MLNVVMLSVENKPFMLSVFKLNVIMLNVVAPMVFQNVQSYFANKNYVCKILYFMCPCCFIILNFNVR
jgi:hypothetical protein